MTRRRRRRIWELASEAGDAADDGTDGYRAHRCTGKTYSDFYRTGGMEPDVCSECADAYLADGNFSAGEIEESVKMWETARDTEGVQTVKIRYPPRDTDGNALDLRVSDDASEDDDA